MHGVKFREAQQSSSKIYKHVTKDKIWPTEFLSVGMFQKSSLEKDLFCFQGAMDQDLDVRFACVIETAYRLSYAFLSVAYQLFISWSNLIQLFAKHT